MNPKRIPVQEAYLSPYPPVFLIWFPDSHHNHSIRPQTTREQYYLKYEILTLSL